MMIFLQQIKVGIWKYDTILYFNEQFSLYFISFMNSR